MEHVLSKILRRAIEDVYQQPFRLLRNWKTTTKQIKKKNVESIYFYILQYFMYKIKQLILQDITTFKNKKDYFFPSLVFHTLSISQNLFLSLTLSLSAAANDLKSVCNKKNVRNFFCNNFVNCPPLHH